MKSISRKISLLAGAILLAFCCNVIAADVVVVVSPENPVRQMTADEVADIFLGRSQTFPGGARATPIDLPENSSVRRDFYQQIAGQSPAQVRMHWAKLIFTGRGHPPRSARNAAAVLKFVNENPDAIGYLERDQVDDKVAIVTIEGDER